MVNSIAVKYQAQLLKATRNFFAQQSFEEILTPPMVENPGMETHIHPFGAYHINENRPASKYLHTSPEFEMKGVLAGIPEFPNIYTLTYCFRDEPLSPHHRDQFIMLEWYRRSQHYTSIMEDCEKLITYCSDQLQVEPPKEFTRVTVNDLFQDTIGMNILDFLDREELKNKISKDFKDVPLPNQECDWDDYFFLLFLNKVEPIIKNYPYLLLYEYPAPLAALSTLKDNKVCERFEIYIKGIEVGNCFNELTNFEEQLQRFHLQAEDKKRLYNYQLKKPLEFLTVLKNGYPESAGIAIGFERLLQGLTGIENPFFR